MNGTDGVTPPLVENGTKSITDHLTQNPKGTYDPDDGNGEVIRTENVTYAGVADKNHMKQGCWKGKLPKPRAS